MRLAVELHFRPDTQEAREWFAKKVTGDPSELARLGFFHASARGAQIVAPLATISVVSIEILDI